jgi:hypothetical protein
VKVPLMQDGRQRSHSTNRTSTKDDDRFSTASPADSSGEANLRTPDSCVASITKSVVIIDNDTPSTDGSSQMTSFSYTCLERPMLDSWRESVVNRIMVDVLKLLNAGSDGRKYCGESGSSQQSSSPGRSSSKSSQSYPSQASRKRSGNQTDGSSNDGTNNGDDGREPKRHRNNAKDSVPAFKRKLACPYYQRKPEIHQKYPSCLTGFASVHRVK